MSDSDILLVEDDSNDVALIRRAFARAGLDVRLHSVEDGEAAVQYLSGAGPYADRAAHPLPDVVLLDLKLPRRSGLEVLAWVRGVARLKRLPVVVLTSSRESTDVNGAYDLGANSYLVKPGSFEDLLGLVQAFDGYWGDCNEQPEIDAIVAWVDRGAPEGKRKQAPPPPQFVNGWNIGTPDLVLEMPVEFSVPASGTIAYQHFLLPTGFQDQLVIVGQKNSHACSLGSGKARLLRQYDRRVLNER